MSNGNTSVNVSGSGLLQVAFIVLKLTGHIKWSWWWVFAPTWIPLSLILIGLTVYFAYLYWSNKA